MGDSWGDPRLRTVVRFAPRDPPPAPAGPARVRSPKPQINKSSNCARSRGVAEPLSCLVCLRTVWGSHEGSARAESPRLHLRRAGRRGVFPLRSPVSPSRASPVERGLAHSAQPPSYLGGRHLSPPGSSAGGARGAGFSPVSPRLPCTRLLLAGRALPGSPGSRRPRICEFGRGVAASWCNPRAPHLLGVPSKCPDGTSQKTPALGGVGRSDFDLHL